MRDSKSAITLVGLHPKARPFFKNFIEDAEEALNITLRITYGIRTFEEQQAIYNQGRVTPGPIVSYARPGWSFHNYGLAIDVCELKEGRLNWNFDYTKLKPFADKYLLRWGGNFKKIVDKPHYELSFGYSIKELYQKYLNKDFLGDTKYLNI